MCFDHDRTIEYPFQILLYFFKKKPLILTPSRLTPQTPPPFFRPHQIGRLFIFVQTDASSSSFATSEISPGEIFGLSISRPTYRRTIVKYLGHGLAPSLTILLNDCLPQSSTPLDPCFKTTSRFQKLAMLLTDTTTVKRALNILYISRERPRADLIQETDADS